MALNPSDLAVNDRGAFLQSGTDVPSQMNPLVVFRQSLPIAAVFLLQSIVPALTAAALVPVFCLIFNQVYDQDYLVLTALAAGLSLPIVQPPSDVTLRLNSTFLQTLGRYSLRWGIVIGILFFIGFATKQSEEFSRRAVTSWIIATPTLASLLTAWLSVLLRRLVVAPANVRTAVFAGFNDASREFARRIAGSPESCIAVRGFFDDRSGQRLGMEDESLLLGGLSDLGAYVNQKGISVIFVALPMRHVQRVMDLLDDLRDTTVSIYYLPDIFVSDLIQARTGEILGTPVVAMCETPFHGFRGVVKRLTDSLLAAAVLLPALPILLVIAVLIKMSSPGSVLFKQRRYGLDGKEITVYKFRTMTVSEDGDDFVQAKRGDSRITTIGHFLRRFSLDELPQLLNVLQGRMSLVGPRPHPIALNEQYRKMIKGYMIRHKVLPGLTGLAQVNGCRGETAKLEEMQARIRYDLDYLRHWTPLLDIKILFLTVVKVFRDDKAY